MEKKSPKYYHTASDTSDFKESSTAKTQGDAFQMCPASSPSSGRVSRCHCDNFCEKKQNAIPFVTLCFASNTRNATIRSNALQSVATHTVKAAALPAQACTALRLATTRKHPWKLWVLAGSSGPPMPRKTVSIELVAQFEKLRISLIHVSHPFSKSPCLNLVSNLLTGEEIRSIYGDLSSSRFQILFEYDNDIRPVYGTSQSPCSVYGVFGSSRPSLDLWHQCNSATMRKFQYEFST
ncbi:hypothetical protein ACLOJK_013333 [Asimina triloba]